MRAARTLSPPIAASMSGSAPVSDIADQIRKLADLRDQGILTEKEFAAHRAKLLA